jgi:hypothetical protein
MMSDVLKEALGGFQKNLSIVEGTSNPGTRSFSEDVTLGIVPIGVVGAPSSSTQSIEVDLPEVLRDMSEQQLDALLVAAKEAGATTEQFFQIADELGEDGIRELLGEEVLMELEPFTTLALGLGGAYAAKKLGVGKMIKTGLKSRFTGKGRAKAQKWKTKRLQHKAGEIRAKADIEAAKAEKGAAKAKRKAAKAERKAAAKAAQPKEEPKHLKQVTKPAAKKPEPTPARKTGGSTTVGKPQDRSGRRASLKGYAPTKKAPPAKKAEAPKKEAPKPAAKKADQRKVDTAQIRPGRKRGEGQVGRAKPVVPAGFGKRKQQPATRVRGEKDRPGVTTRATSKISAKQTERKARTAAVKEVAKKKRVLTPEQRAAKSKRQKERRAAAREKKKAEAKKK